MTNESWTPWQTLAATQGLGVLTPGWNLAEAAGDGEDECRFFSHAVEFEGSFSGAPVVSLGLTGFDLDQRDSGRLSLKVRDVTSTGFVVDVIAWRGSRVYSVEFSWLAVGA